MLVQPTIFLFSNDSRIGERQPCESRKRYDDFCNTVFDVMILQDDLRPHNPQMRAHRRRLHRTEEAAMQCEQDINHETASQHIDPNDPVTHVVVCAYSALTDQSYTACKPKDYRPGVVA